MRLIFTQSFVLFPIWYKLPLMQRKEKLAALFLRETPRFAFSRFIEGRGTSLYQLCEEQELEGVVAKHKGHIQQFLFSAEKAIIRHERSRKPFCRQSDLKRVCQQCAPL